jgi:hypothetical protein
VSALLEIREIRKHHGFQKLSGNHVKVRDFDEIRQKSWNSYGFSGVIAKRNSRFGPDSIHPIKGVKSVHRPQQMKKLELFEFFFGLFIVLFNPRSDVSKPL